MDDRPEPKNAGDHSLRARREISDMRARRETADMSSPRTEAPECRRLRVALVQFRCPTCGKNYPMVTHTDGHVRSIKCRGCGDTGKLIVRSNNG